MREETAVNKTPLKPSRGGTRIGYIDALKGFTILCVVLGHIAGGYFDAKVYPEFTRLLGNIHNVIYLFHMPLFMMISGYVYGVAYFKDTGAPRGKKIYRQVCNIFLVYVLFSVLFAAMKTLASAYISKQISIFDVLFIPVRPIQSFWYLYVLGLLYLLFSFQSFYKLDRWVAAGLLFCLCCISNYFVIEWFQISRLMYFAFFFYIGLMKGQYPKGIANNRVLICCSFFLSIVLCCIYFDRIIYVIEEISTKVPPPATALIAIGISLAIWFLFWKFHCLAENRLLITLGRYSLEIYLIHSVLVTCFRTVFPKFGLTKGCVCLALNFILSITIPILFSLICKKLGIYELLFKPINFFTKKGSA